jgi:hypothetical protein
LINDLVPLLITQSAKSDALTNSHL